MATVLTSQPGMVTTGVTTWAFDPGMEMWSSSLFDCFDDMGICCLGFWCPSCHACKVSSDHGEGLCLPMLEMWSGMVPIAGMGLRISIRERYRIKGSIADDCTVATFCSPCSYCQMARELKERRLRHTRVISSTTVQVTNPPAYAAAHYPIQQDFSHPQ